MDINIIIKELISRLSFIEPLMKQVNFKYINSQNFIAIFYKDTVYYTGKLFSDLNHEEQLFTVAHEVLHFGFHGLKRDSNVSTKDERLLNYVEDAWINQLLIKFGLTPPIDAVLIPDASDYSIDELYNMYFPNLKDIVQNYDFRVDVDSVIKK